MAIIIGESGCTTALKDELAHRGFSFRDLDGITRFHEDVDGIIDDVVDDINERFDGRLAALHAAREKASSIVSDRDAGILARAGARLRSAIIGFKAWLAGRARPRAIDTETRPYLAARRFLDGERDLIAGARGEEMVIAALRELPDEFTVINDVFIDLGRSHYWRNGHEHVRSAQIDHVVAGPPGVFLVETKNWRDATMQRATRTPHFQVDRASFAVWVAQHQRWFHEPFKTRSLVVTTRRVRVLHHPFVNHPRDPRQGRNVSHVHVGAWWDSRSS